MAHYFSLILQLEFENRKNILTILILSVTLNGVSLILVSGGSENHMLSLPPLALSIILLTRAAYLIGESIKEIARIFRYKNIHYNLFLRFSLK